MHAMQKQGLSWSEKQNSSFLTLDMRQPEHVLGKNKKNKILIVNYSVQIKKYDVHVSWVQRDKNTYVLFANRIWVN